MRKKGQTAGVMKGISLVKHVLDALDLGLLQKIKNEKLYKNDGYDNFESFVKDVTGHSADTIERRLKTAREIGAAFTSILLSLDMKPRQLSLLEHLLTKDQKASLRAGILKVGECEIAVTEENAADIQAAVDALIKDHTKGVKASAKINDAQNQLIDDLTAIKQKYERQYPYKDHDWVDANRPVHSHLWEAFLGDFQAFVLNDRAMNNDEAHAYMRELYDRIVGNLYDLNEVYKRQTGGLSFIRNEGPPAEKRGSK